MKLVRLIYRGTIPLKILVCIANYQVYEPLNCKTGYVNYVCFPNLVHVN